MKKAGLVSTMVVLMVCSLSFGELSSWDFNDGTTQGWYVSFGSSQSIVNNALATVGADAGGVYVAEAKVENTDYDVVSGSRISFDYINQSGSEVSLGLWTWDNGNCYGLGNNSRYAYTISTPAVGQWAHADISLFDFSKINPSTGRDLAVGDKVGVLSIYNAGSSSSLWLRLDNVQFVPEPGILSLLAMGGLGLLRRKR